MEHSYIEERDIADRYLMGKLSAEERMRFEEHLEDCEQCIERLETSDGLRAGLRIIAAEEVEKARASAQAGFLARIDRYGRTAKAAMLAAIFLLIALPQLWMIRELSRARRDLAQATTNAAEWRRKYEENEQASRDLIKDMTGRGEQPSMRRDQSSVSSERKRELSPRQPDGMEVKRPSNGAAPVFALSVARGAEPDMSQPVNRIELTQASKLIVLLLELGPDPRLKSYRAAISTADGRSVWRQSQLTPNTKDGLSLSLNSDLLKPGNYLLALEGITTDNRNVLAGRYTFSVTTR
jgi:hypothetical protein